MSSSIVVLNTTVIVLHFPFTVMYYTYYFIINYFPHFSFILIGYHSTFEEIIRVGW